MFTFLARQVARHGNDLVVNRTLFEQVLESLCSSTPAAVEEGYRHEERQQAVLELYAAGGLDHFDQVRLIQLAESAGFYRVCETVYESRREFDKIVSCYWRDPARSHVTVNYIQRVLADGSVSEAEKDKIRSTVFDNVEQLIRIDARRVAKLMLVTLQAPVNDVISKIGSQHEDAVFEFLSRVFELVSTSVLDTSIEPHVYELYVELMCRYSSQAEIVSFLQSAPTYDEQSMINICKRYNVTEAVIFLFEKQGKFDEAFDLALDSLNASLMLAFDNDFELDKLESQVFDIIHLLQRCSSRLEQSNRERVWFNLLDSLVETLTSNKMASLGSARAQTCVDRAKPLPSPAVDCGAVDECLKSATKHVINAMMSHVALPAILQRIVVTEGSGVAATFGNVRDLLYGVLESCAYERTLLSTCARLVHSDLHAALVSMTSSVKRGTALHDEQCAKCKRVMTSCIDNVNSVLVSFNCGHTFHRLCLVDNGRVGAVSPTARRMHNLQLLPPGVNLQCPVCTQTTLPASKPPANQTPGAAVQLNSPNSPSCKRDALDANQLLAIEYLRSMRKTPSRLSLLGELAHVENSRQTHQQKNSHKLFGSANGMLLNELNILHLAPPPPPAD